MTDKSDVDIFQNALSFIRGHHPPVPKIGIILGSGLGGFADKLEHQIKIPTKDIPDFPRSTVAGHAGFLVYGDFQDIPLLVLQGRTHFYEGHRIQDVAFVVRLMTRLDIEILLVTNAAGGINPRFSPGDLMIISDHINFMFQNPLSGPVISGESRWTDMYHAYDPTITDIIEQAGRELKIPLKKGVLFASTGPTYETAAEVRMARLLGADAVSMSTIPEVLTARANGIKVAGITCITNMATGISANPLTHEEVTRIAAQTGKKFERLVREVVLTIGKSHTRR